MIVTNTNTAKKSEGRADSLCSKSDKHVKSAEEAKLIAAAAVETCVLGVDGRAVTANWASCRAVSSSQNPCIRI